MNDLNVNYISFEGLDGTGKSATLRDVKHYFKQHQLMNKSIFVNEPGSTTQALRIRHLLLSKSSQDMDEATQAYLMASARADLINTKIMPALRSEQRVISGRCLLSSLAYQGPSLGLKPTAEINRIATHDFKILPNTIFYFKPQNINSIQKRLNQRKSRKNDWMDDKIKGAKNMASLENSYQRAIMYWKHHFGRVIMINANQNRQQRCQTVIQYIKYILK